MKQSLIFIFLLIILQNCSYAFSYFEIDSTNYLLKKDGTTAVNIHFDLEGYSPEDFSIKAIVSEGLAFIYSEDSASWTSSGGLWTEMPELTKIIKLKLTTNTNANVKLAIQNKITGEIYETGPKVFYSYRNLEKYQKRLKLKINDNI